MNLQKVDPDSGMDLFDSYDYFDKIHVQELFRDLERDPESHDLTYLVDRLSKANTTRRRILAHTKRHHSKLLVSTSITPLSIDRSQALDKEEKQGQRSPGAALQIAESAHGMSNPTTATLLDPNRQIVDSMSSVSESVYAPTARGPDNEVADIPPPPNIGLAKNFECPYCFCLCSKDQIKEKSWRNHVLHDLRPYLCTYPECVEEDRLFDTRQDWINHENRFHVPTWRCIHHVNETFESEADYRSHLLQEHEMQDTDSATDVIVRAGLSSTTHNERPCPFCGKDYSNATDMQLHVAYHLERFSVFALPRSHHLERDDGDIEAGSNSNQAIRQRRGSFDDAIHTDQSDLTFKSQPSENDLVQPIDERAAVNSEPSSHGTPKNSEFDDLYRAVELGDTTLVTDLLLRRVDVNGVEGHNETALTIASGGGHEEICRLLIKHGADVNMQSGVHGTALIAAAVEGHLDVARLLIEHGADVNAQGGSDTSALAAAAVGGHLDVAQLLLEHGADVNTQDEGYGTALIAAAWGGHYNIVQLLLEHGAYQSVQSGEYESALATAYNRQNEKVVQLLLDYNPDHRVLDSAARKLRDSLRFKEAEGMYKRLLAERERAVGLYDRSTIDGIASLAKMYRKMDRLQDAEALYEEIIDRRPKTSSEVHPVILSSMENLGIIYEEQGLLDKGALMIESALEWQGQVDEIGKIDHSTVKLRGILARIYRKRGRNKVAEGIRSRHVKLEDGDTNG